MVLGTEQWTLIYGKREYNNANKCVDMLNQACGSMGIKINDPDYIEVPEDMARKRDGSGFIQCIKEDIEPKT